MRRLAGALLLAAGLAGCSATPSPDATGDRAVRNLERGYCPPSIINPQGKAADGRYRYGRETAAATLDGYRERELANCRNAVGGGDSDALKTLVAYYDGTGQQALLVSALETFLPRGVDRRSQRYAADYLYHAYAEGSAQVPRDPERAFTYLAAAVDFGARDLALTYAAALEQRGRGTEAVAIYRSAADGNGYRREDNCEGRLALAQAYFAGRGVEENWNLGYYHWQRGIAIAGSPQWGSCAKDNFVYGDRYSAESTRKRFVDQRLAAMTTSQKAQLDSAVRDQRRGEDWVAALPFSRPPNASAAPALAYAAGPSGWPSWQPLQAPVCQLRTLQRPLGWSGLFEHLSPTVWSLESTAPGRQSRGSAVAVSARLLVTNCHLVNDPARITLRQPGRQLQGSLRAADRAGDRCIVEASGPLPVYAGNGRGHGALRIGEDVATIGNPRGLEGSLSRGIVAQKRQRDGLQLIQTDAAISSGSSGGGLFDANGNLVGITTFTVSEGQSLNFALAIDEFCR